MLHSSRRGHYFGFPSARHEYRRLPTPLIDQNTGARHPPLSRFLRTARTTGAATLDEKGGCYHSLYSQRNPKTADWLRHHSRDVFHKSHGHQEWTNANNFVSSSRSDNTTQTDQPDLAQHRKTDIPAILAGRPAYTPATTYAPWLALSTLSQSRSQHFWAHE